MYYFTTPFFAALAQHSKQTPFQNHPDKHPIPWPQRALQRSKVEPAQIGRLLFQTAYSLAGDGLAVASMAFGGGTFAISQQAHTCGRAMPFLPMARQLRTCCAANQMLQSHRSAPLLTVRPLPVWKVLAAALLHGVLSQPNSQTD